MQYPQRKLKYSTICYECQCRQFCPFLKKIKENVELSEKWKFNAKSPFMWPSFQEKYKTWNFVRKKSLLKNLCHVWLMLTFKPNHLPPCYKTGTRRTEISLLSPIPRRSLPLAPATQPPSAPRPRIADSVEVYIFLGFGPVFIFLAKSCQFNLISQKEKCS